MKDESPFQRGVLAFCDENSDITRQVVVFANIDINLLQIILSKFNIKSTCKYFYDIKHDVNTRIIVTDIGCFGEYNIYRYKINKKALETLLKYLLTSIKGTRKQ